MNVILLYMNSYPRRQCFKLRTGLICFRIGSSEHGNEHSGSITDIMFLDWISDRKLAEKNYAHGDEFLGFLRTEVNVLDGSSELGF